MLVLTVIAGVVIALLIGATRSEDAQAQSSSPGLVATAQRVEVPEEAYAVTYPDGWEVAVFPVAM